MLLHQVCASHGSAVADQSADRQSAAPEAAVKAKRRTPSLGARLPTTPGGCRNNTTKGAPSLRAGPLAVRGIGGLKGAGCRAKSTTGMEPARTGPIRCMSPARASNRSGRRNADVQRATRLHQNRERDVVVDGERANGLAGKRCLGHATHKSIPAVRQPPDEPRRLPNARAAGCLKSRAAEQLYGHSLFGNSGRGRRSTGSWLQGQDRRSTLFGSPKSTRRRPKAERDSRHGAMMATGSGQRGQVSILSLNFLPPMFGAEPRWYSPLPRRYSVWCDG